MELFAAISLLWRHRLLLVLGLVVAGAVGWSMTRGAMTSFGVASVSVMVDTSPSELADAQPDPSNTVPDRAALLADLAESDEIARRIAREMQISTEQLIVKAPYLATPGVATPLPKHALDAAWAAEAPYVLAIQVRSLLPIIDINASGPRASDAARLAGAAAAALEREPRAYDGERGTASFVVEPIGAVHAAAVRSGPRRVIGLVAAAVVFTFWCYGMLFLSAARRALRSAGWTASVRGEA